MDMKTPRPKKMWALYNCSTLWCIGRTKTECIQEAEVLTGEQWSKCNKYMQILPVIVSPVILANASKGGE